MSASSRFPGGTQRSSNRQCCVAGLRRDREGGGLRRSRRWRPPAQALSAFSGFRFLPEVILLAVRWHLRYGLSSRNLEESLAQRGIEVDHVTPFRCVQRLASTDRFGTALDDDRTSSGVASRPSVINRCNVAPGASRALGPPRGPEASATLSGMDVTARAMAGGQFYNENSLTQASAAANGLALIDAAIRDLRDVGPAPVVADFGSAGAGNSLQPVARAIERLRSQHAMDEVTVVHADLADNDWKAMFATISERPDSYVNLATPARVLAAAGSFYDRLLPSSWVDLAWTSGSLHWLSHLPCPIDGHFFVQSSTDARANGIPRHLTCRLGVVPRPSRSRTQANGIPGVRRCPHGRRRCHGIRAPLQRRRRGHSPCAEQR